MNIWLDNTGLQAAGRALQRRGRGPLDSDSLLQLITLLVFAERLRLNGFERPLVAAPTIETRDRLLHLGVPEAALEIVPVSLESYLTACEQTADRCAEELPWAFQPEQQDIVGLEPDLADEGRRSAREFLDLIEKGQGFPTLREAVQEFSDQKGTAALRYMMVASDSFRRTVGSLVKSRDRWSAQQTDQLSAFVRFFLNNVLAD